MQLEVFWPWGSRRTNNKYSIFYIEVFENQTHRPAKPSEIEDLKLLVPRIQAMGTKILLQEFQSITLNEEAGRLELSVVKGIVYAGNKVLFSSFRGWIELCMLEKLISDTG